MKIAFHSEQLGLRGTEIALFDYAFYNRVLLGNESVIIAPSNSDITSYDKFSTEFDVYLYNDFADVTEYVHINNIDAIYFIKAGLNDGKLIPGIKNLVHAVFQLKQPHGDVYAYVSDWLANKMNGIAVPHMIDIAKHNHNFNFRKQLNIPDDSIVFGYYGGSDSFNIEYARRAVRTAVEQDSNIYFLFMNSENFIDHSNVLFFQGTTNIQQKIGFINTCNACIHARNGGESFGLTVGEFSSLGKPIITTSYCKNSLCDEAHLDILGEKAIIYNDYESLLYILTNFKDVIKSKNITDWNAYQDYTPEKIMKRFKDVFLT